ncbi:hypothetical protein CEUSTIGMA_g6102.t1 [Chlamydomonas eustigma]|uniref:Wax synthase domain-containing protein n=1 Tax=Chlamydomonas eustigma TaxID=1157962 RepID=A0A250X6F0_9CHLO|nr:hypothetical protein CEUSTIGMA_g6102.t1 [Chlamydomonas eustigma]|eukprot:GAX78664.1 hypothetical protein CEUSTIGMA_g6102.t1 [Chlamydomonas eustigma]
MEYSQVDALAVQQAACRGRLCSSPSGLDLRHFPVYHTVECFTLIIVFFLGTWWIAYTLLHETTGTRKRCVGAVLLSILYLALVCHCIPWNPYWIRELHVMVWVVSSWKLLDLALLREGEALERPWIHFIGYDAISLRPALRPSEESQKGLHIQDQQKANISKEAQCNSSEASGTFAFWSYFQSEVIKRLTAAAPVLGLAFVQYLGVEALSSYLMHQPLQLDSLGLRDRIFFSCTFAACLYLHLSYFFWSICALGLIARGDEVSYWMPPFNHPYAASSPVDFWSYRWHSMFRWYYVRLVYRPVYHLLLNKCGSLGDKAMPRAVATVSVFVASGLFHEMLLWINFGRATGEQLLFFLIHAVALLVHRSIYPKVSGSSMVIRLKASQVMKGQAVTVTSASTHQGMAEFQLSLPKHTDSLPAREAPSSSSLRRRRIQATTQSSNNMVGVSSDGTDWPADASWMTAVRQDYSEEIGVDKPAGCLRDHDSGATSIIARAGPSSDHEGGGVAALPAMSSGNSSQQSVGATKGDEQAPGSTSAGDIQEPTQGITHVAESSTSSCHQPPQVAGRWLLRMVRHALSVVAFQSFLALTLVLFFAPWFRFGYHHELRVFVPGPVHYAVRAAMTRVNEVRNS